MVIIKFIYIVMKIKIFVLFIPSPTDLVGSFLIKNWSKSCPLKMN